MTTTTAIDPRVRLVHLPSAALGIEKKCYVYLPDDYMADGPPLPVLYLLRGHEREWVHAAEDSSRGGTTAIDVYERVRATGAVGPLIMVMPGLASDDNGVPSMLADFARPDLAAAATGIGAGQFQRYFFEELIPTIDRDYRTNPALRALGGFSLGGYMAVKAAALRPELFVSVAAYDGSFPYASDGGRAARAGDAIFAAPMFDAALGVPRRPAPLTAHGLIPLLLRADQAALRRISWAIQYGPEHREPWDANFYRGEHLLRFLGRIGISNAISPAAIAEGSHTWAVADRHLAATLPIHGQAFARAIARQPYRPA